MNKKTLWFVIAVLACLGIARILYTADKKVAIMWSGHSGRAERVLEGFMEEMSRSAPNLRLIISRDIRPMEEAEKRFKEFEATVDGIVFLRSNGAKFLARANPKIPCFFGACNNPVELGVVKSLSEPEGKLTGETYFIPFEKCFEVIQQMFPQAKRIGYLGEKGHSGTPIEQRDISQECSRRHLEYHEVIADSVRDLVTKLENLVPQVDLILLGNESLIFDHVIDIVAVANKTKTPLFGFMDKVVQRGAVAGLVTHDQTEGAMLAESVVDVVVKGKPVSQVPVKTCAMPIIMVNRGMAEFLGISVPSSLLPRVTWVE